MKNNKGTAAATYEKMCSARDPFLVRARDCSLYTIPSLIPQDGHSGSTELYKPFQSIGARGVNSLASKLLLTLLPPTRRFHRLILDKQVQDQIPPEQYSLFEQALSKAEDRIDKKIEALGVRVSSFEMFRHLVVAGNVLINVNENGMRVFPIDQYVVRRDWEGTLLEIVVKEIVSPETLPSEVRDSIMSNTQDKKELDQNQDLYTHVYKDGEGWKVYQEVRGKTFNHGTYGKRKLPWVALRWTRIDGEDYGRGHCEEYIGDLIAAESLSRSIIRASAIAAKVVFLRNPNGVTDADDLQNAEEGEVIDGVDGDIKPLSIEKSQDFTIARATLEDVLGRLSYAFLLNSAIRRQGERVTAEEIRYMAAELEDTLGGVYSVLSREFQLPMVEIAMFILEKENAMPPLPENMVKPTIITGIDALGRSHELNRLDAFLGGAIQMFGPELLTYINLSDYLRRRATGLDLETAGLIRSEQEIAQMQQMQQQQAMVQKLGPAVIKGVADQTAAASAMPQQG